MPRKPKKAKNDKGWIWCPYNKDIACYSQQCEKCEENPSEAPRNKKE